MPRLDTFRGTVAIFLITTVAIFICVYAIDCLFRGACQ